MTVKTSNQRSNPAKNEQSSDIEIIAEGWASQMSAYFEKLTERVGDWSRVENESGRDFSIESFNGRIARINEASAEENLALFKDINSIWINFTLDDEEKDYFSGMQNASKQRDIRTGEATTPVEEEANYLVALSNEEYAYYYSQISDKAAITLDNNAEGKLNEANASHEGLLEAFNSGVTGNGWSLRDDKRRDVFANDVTWDTTRLAIYSHAMGSAALEARAEATGDEQHRESVALRKTESGRVSDRVTADETTRSSIPSSPLPPSAQMFSDVQIGVSQGTVADTKMKLSLFGALSLMKLLGTDSHLHDDALFEFATAVTLAVARRLVNGTPDGELMVDLRLYLKDGGAPKMTPLTNPIGIVDTALLGNAVDKSKRDRVLPESLRAEGKFEKEVEINVDDVAPYMADLLNRDREDTKRTFYKFAPLLNAMSHLHLPDGRNVWDKVGINYAIFTRKTIANMTEDDEKSAHGIDQLYIRSRAVMAMMTSDTRNESLLKAGDAFFVQLSEAIEKLWPIVNNHVGVTMKQHEIVEAYDRAELALAEVYREAYLAVGLGEEGAKANADAEMDAFRIHVEKEFETNSKYWENLSKPPR